MLTLRGFGRHGHDSDARETPLHHSPPPPSPRFLLQFLPHFRTSSSSSADTNATAEEVAPLHDDNAPAEAYTPDSHNEVTPLEQEPAITAQIEGSENDSLVEKNDLEAPPVPEDDGEAEDEGEGEVDDTASGEPVVPESPKLEPVILFEGSHSLPTISLFPSPDLEETNVKAFGDELSSLIESWAEAQDDREWDDGKSAVETFVSDYHSGYDTLRVPIISYLGSNEMAREALDGMETPRSDARDRAIRWYGKTGVDPSRPSSPASIPSTNEPVTSPPTSPTPPPRNNALSIEILPLSPTPPPSFNVSSYPLKSLRHKSSTDTLPQRGQKFLARRLRRAARRLWPF